MYRFSHKDLLGMDQLSVNDINKILDTAHAFTGISSREIKKVPALRGKSIITFFHEPSTRTKASFEMAAEVTISGPPTMIPLEVLRLQGIWRTAPFQ